MRGGGNLKRLQCRVLHALVRHTGGRFRAVNTGLASFPSGPPNSRSFAAPRASSMRAKVRATRAAAVPRLGDSGAGRDGHRIDAWLHGRILRVTNLVARRLANRYTHMYLMP